MSRSKKISFLALALLALLVGVLVSRNRQAPQLPPDSDHVGFSGVDLCLDCHGPEGVLAKSRNHPVGNDCFRCHGTD
jgi:cytochrome c553